MPAASWVLLAALVGSAGGASASTALHVCAIIATLAIARVLRSGGLAISLAAVAIAAAGAARATADRWRDGQCRAVIVRDTVVHFVSDLDLVAGDAGTATLRPGDGACEMPGLVRAGRALRGGVWYRTTDDAQPAGRRLQLAVRHADALAHHDRRAALRAAGIRRVDSVFGGDAPMARALLLADMHLIAPEMRQRWARAGLVHLLSVSGVHVAIVAGALLLLLNSLRVPARPATIAALALTTVYVVILGLPPPAVRAAVMFGSLHVAKLRQRPASVWSVLTVGALLPVIVDSQAPLDLGWQLSVLGVIALAASGRFAGRLAWFTGGRTAALRREFAASITASIASAPLIAWHFGTVSLIAPFANLLAAPVVTVLQPTLFLALAASPSPRFARFIAGTVHPLLAALDWIAGYSAGIHWAAIDLSPTLAQCLIGGAGVLALLVAMCRDEVTRPLQCAAVCAGLLLATPMLGTPGSGRMELHLLDVGQGDAVAVRTPHGSWIVFDAGGGPPGIDRGRRTVLPYLRRLGGSVEAFVLSHPHLDHVGGAPALIGATRPARFFDGAFAGGTGAYRAALESAGVHHLQWTRVHPGDTATIDGVTLRFLAPDSAWASRLTDANLASAVVRVEYGATSALLVGDAELEEENWLLCHTPATWLRADILKVGHHGSRTSSSPAFLDAVGARLALVSVGRGNSYGHPSSSVLQEFARREIPLLRTDVEGTTVVVTDGSEITVTTAASRWSLPSAPSKPPLEPSCAR